LFFDFWAELDFNNKKSLHLSHSGETKGLDFRGTTLISSFLLTSGISAAHRTNPASLVTVRKPVSA
jgi:hypothetical protein